MANPTAKIAHIADYYYAVARLHEKFERYRQAGAARRKANDRYAQTYVKPSEVGGDEQLAASMH